MMRRAKVFSKVISTLTICALLALGLAGCTGGSTVSQVVSRVGDDIGETVSRVGDDIGDAVSRVESAVESFFEEPASSRLDEELSSAGSRAPEESREEGKEEGREESLLDSSRTEG